MVPATAFTRPLDARRARLVTRFELILATDGPEDGRAVALEAVMDEMEFLRDLYREVAWMHELERARRRLPAVRAAPLP